MLTSYVVGLAAIAILLLAWVGVQNAWRRAFLGVSSDADVLAARGGCAGCTCDSNGNQSTALPQEHCFGSSIQEEDP
jgi:hypothetical protein